VVFLLLLVNIYVFLVELTRGESFIVAYAAVPYEISHGVDYSDLFPDLFELKVGRFYIQLASERGPDSVLKLIKEHAQSNQMIFVGVIDPINPNVETPEEVRNRSWRRLNIFRSTSWGGPTTVVSLHLEMILPHQGKSLLKSFAPA
jgi:methionine synthase II (cobalamin-independent)